MSFNPRNPAKYKGTDKTITFFVTRDRSPTGADYRQPETGRLYTIGTVWQVAKSPTTGTEGDLWMLSKIVSNVAYWVQCSSGVIPSGSVLTLSDTVNTLVYPTEAGNIQLEGTAGQIDIVSDPGNNKLVFSLPGGGGAVDSFTVQEVTAPGVNNVEPTIAGVVTVNGAVVTNHSVPLETRTRALNTYNVEVQYAEVAATTDGSKSGVAHFKSSQFSVDGTGFVTLSGTGSGQTITGNDMVALPPTGGNWNIYGLEETVTSGSGSTLSILSPRVATFIVDPVANRGTHTTIATAIAAASSGDSICIRPGTYTEDLTIKTGLTIWGNPGGGLNSTIINGTLTFTGAVTSSFSDIIFTSNSGPIIVVDGAGTNQSRFYSCNFDSTTHDLMTINNASGNPFFTECFFGLATNTKLFTITLSGQPQFAYCKFNSYGTLVVSNIAAGRVYFRFCELGQLKLSTSGAAGANTFISYCLWDPSANHTFLSTTGSGRSEIVHSYFNSGTSSAFNIGAGTQADFSAVSIISSNPSPIAGAGIIAFPSTLYGV